MNLGQAIYTFCNLPPYYKGKQLKNQRQLFINRHFSFFWSMDSFYT